MKHTLKGGPPFLPCPSIYSKGCWLSFSGWNRKLSLDHIGAEKSIQREILGPGRMQMWPSYEGGMGICNMGKFLKGAIWE